MTAPDGASPPGSLAVGLFRDLQTKTVDEMKSTMSGGVMGAFEHVQDTTHSEITEPLAEKPNVEEVPIDSTLWQTMHPREQSTFPRSQLISGTAANTASGGSGDSSHSHNLNRIPDYQPSGNNNDFLEIGFIRVSKDISFNAAGFITGDSATFAGVTGAYLGVFRMNPTTGDLTLLNTATRTFNLRDHITNTNTEHIFTLGETFTAEQNEVLAIGLIQDTSVVQTPASVMCTRITDLNRDTSTARPRKQYCYAGPYNTGLIPLTIAESSLNYSASTKLPFYYVREV